MTTKKNNTRIPRPTEPLDYPLPKSWIIWSLRVLVQMIDAGERALGQALDDIAMLIETAIGNGYDPNGNLRKIAKQVLALFPLPTEDAVKTFASAIADSLEGMEVVFRVLDSDQFDARFPGTHDTQRHVVEAGSQEERELLNLGGGLSLDDGLALVQEGLSMLADVENGDRPDDARVKRYVADTIRSLIATLDGDSNDDDLRQLVIVTEHLAVQAAKAGLCSVMQLSRMADDAREGEFNYANATKYVRDVASYIEGAGQSANQQAVA